MKAPIIRIITTFVTAYLLLNPAVSSAKKNLWQIYEIAQQQDATHQVSKAQYAYTKENIPIQRGQLLPQINAQGFYGRQKIITDNFKIGPDDNRGFSLNLSMPIYQHQLWSALKSAHYEVKQAALTDAIAQQSLIIRTAERYFKVLAAEDNLKFIRQEKAALQHLLEQKKAELAVGLIPITELHETQANYDLSLSSEISAKNRLDNAREALTEITNEKSPSLAKLKTEFPLSEPSPTNTEKWITQAKINNLEINIKQLDIEIAKQNVSSKWANHFPKFDLVGERSISKSPNLFGVDTNEQRSLQIQATLPLFAGGTNRAKVRQANHLLDQRQRELTESTRNITRKTREAYLNILSNIKKIKALKQTTRSSKEALEANKMSVTLGTRNIQDLLAAQSNMYQAQRNLSQAKYEYLINGLKLVQLTNQLSPQDLQKINQWLE